MSSDNKTKAEFPFLNENRFKRRGREWIPLFESYVWEKKCSTVVAEVIYGKKSSEAANATLMTPLKTKTRSVSMLEEAEHVEVVNARQKANNELYHL